MKDRKYWQLRISGVAFCGSQNGCLKKINAIVDEILELESKHNQELGNLATMAQFHSGCVEITVDVDGWAMVPQSFPIKVYLGKEIG